jgi:hypothetical protein
MLMVPKRNWHEIPHRLGARLRGRRYHVYGHRRHRMVRILLFLRRSSESPARWRGWSRWGWLCSLSRSGRRARARAGIWRQGGSGMARGRCSSRRASTARSMANSSGPSWPRAAIRDSHEKRSRQRPASTWSHQCNGDLIGSSDGSPPSPGRPMTRGRLILQRRPLGLRSLPRSNPSAGFTYGPGMLIWPPNCWRVRARPSLGSISWRERS